MFAPMPAPSLAAPVLGAALVLLALADVFLTVLHARADAGVISPRLNRAIWALFRGGARLAGRHAESLLTYAGPVLLAATAVVWVALLGTGFALIFWPALGRDIAMAAGPTPRDFLTALYFSGTCLTTLGFGEILPLTTPYRLLAVAESAVGFSVVTLALTYFLSIYSALIRRNAFALELDFASGGHGDAAEMLVRMTAGEGVRSTKDEFAMMGRELLNLLQTHHSFPAIHFFRRRETGYAPARIALLTLDAASLARSALDPKEHAAFIKSSAVELFWRGGLQLARETARDVVPADLLAAENYPNAAAWRRRYAQARCRFAAAGMAVEPDADEGTRRYVSLRGQWDAHVRSFAAYMGYDWWKIDPLTEAD
jgi:hypothetical protein